ncbi:MAG TPA: tRNA (adenosine(37)-N6)-threonylcarbamoyltransferase complex dimerization subunit type 1 TsaB [Steroidobacteraceae bacterium]
MKLLALDTATEALSVSLAIDAAQIDRYVEIERGHAEQLLPMVEAMLAEGGITLGDLDAIAFGRGPGGFTGVRLAASVAQGLAFGAGVGVIPVSDLAAVAERARLEDPTVDSVLVVNDARMREVYWGRFAVSGHLICMRGEEQVSGPAGVELPPGGPWIAAGRGLRAWPELAARCANAGASVHPDWLPRASEVLALARSQASAGRVLDPAQALPVYVRDKVAEPTA